MQILEIKLTGHIKPGQFVPDVFATIHRTPGNNYLTVTMITSDSEREHIVDADCPEDIWSMAECLQVHLDGFTGTKSEIHDYYRILGYFMD